VQEDPDWLVDIASADGMGASAGIGHWMGRRAAVRGLWMAETVLGSMVHSQ